MVPGFRRESDGGKAIASIKGGNVPGKTKKGASEAPFSCSST